MSVNRMVDRPRGSATWNPAGSAVAAAVLLVLAALAGCQDPLHRTLEQELAEQMAGQQRRYLESVAGAGPMQVDRMDTEALLKGLTEPQQAEILKMSGLDSYRDTPLRPSKDLTGAAQSPAVGLALSRAVELAVRHNLAVGQARLAPAAARAQITEAEAAFDAVYFAEVEHNILDTPRPPSNIPSFGPQQNRNSTLRTGIRKPLTTGAQVAVETGFSRLEQNPSLFAVNGGKFTHYTADVLLSVTQPLLRNFGTDVNTAPILLAQSARRQSALELRSSLLRTVADVERAYWTLVLARAQLLIQQRLLQRHLEDVDLIEKRGNFDQSKAALMQARSFAEIARADVIRAGENVRRASDQLKRLMNSDELPLTGEAVLTPLDAPLDAPVSFSLTDSVRTALQERPELQVALARINDATIQQRVADNLRLPSLNVGGGVRFNGLNVNDVPGAYSEIGDGDFIDFLINAAFEIPIGNRGPEAQLQRRKIERQAAVLAYRDAAQQTVLEVKNALRDLRAAYELIAAARSARLAAAQNLRTFIVKQEAGERANEVFMDQKLRSEQRLAQAEASEVQAMTDYNIALAELHRATGTLLERNRVRVESDDTLSDPSTDGPAQDTEPRAN